MFASSPTSFLSAVSFQPTTALKSSTPRNTSSTKFVASYSTKETKTPHFFATKMASSISLYEILGISTSASCHEIKTAYRKLARVCHPDVVAMNQKETSTNDFMKIHSAYLTLSNPEKRAQYDRETYNRPKWNISSSSLTSATIASMSGFPVYAHASRNWETDQCW
ncbi:Chaperone protein dnaJ 11 like [Quillaja saponaria]|uniref:Chaperone protein dnaJ 11 like n=1 Tax=Quillaja saponaria TaxID=32244 RepID=A0AAD7M170_QUISA|nr:Chaperone protein dnaJ 11 like [Quillaja saponaria]